MSTENKATDTATKNLELWNKVSDTDRLYTKDFTRGNFVGTSINPTYLIQKATETWGPMGIGWGTKVLSERFEEGGPLGTMGDKIIFSKAHIIQIELWYNQDGKTGSVTQFGQTTFVGQNAMGAYYTDEDAPKKSMTDAMTKCLSLLGFSADIFLGTFDGKNDNTESPEAAKNNKQVSKAAEAKAPAKDTDDETQADISSDARKFIAALQNATINRVGMSEKTIDTRFSANNKDYLAVKNAIAERKKALQNENIA